MFFFNEKFIKMKEGKIQEKTHPRKLKLQNKNAVF